MLAGVALVVGMLALSAALPAVAQESTPTTPSAEQDLGTRSRGLSMHLGFGRGSWTTYDAVAEALGLSPLELFTELHSGKSVEEIAEARGIDLQVVDDAVKAAQLAEQKSRIEQALEDGKITQEQYDWMLQGLEQGWSMGHGGRGHGMRGRGAPPSDSESSSSTLSVTPGGTSL